MIANSSNERNQTKKPEPIALRANRDYDTFMGSNHATDAAHAYLLAKLPPRLRMLRRVALFELNYGHSEGQDPEYPGYMRALAELREWAMREMPGTLYYLPESGEISESAPVAVLVCDTPAEILDCDVCGKDLEFSKEEKTWVHLDDSVTYMHAAEPTQHEHNEICYSEEPYVELERRELEVALFGSLRTEGGW